MNNSINVFIGDYSFLSNFFRSVFQENNVIYLSGEHYYQSHKAKNEQDFNFILSSETPAVAKRRGKEIKIRDDWENIKTDVMEKAIKLKFSNPILKEKLIKTYPLELVEGNTWGDTEWGVCKGKGKNLLGKILMKIRDELIREEK